MENLKAVILKFFNKIPYIVSISLFGSQARNQANAHSDVDVAVLFERGHIPDISQVLEWQEELSGLLQKEVDLLCLNIVSPIVGMQVYNHGIHLIIKNPSEYMSHQIVLFSDYAELKKLREPMEKNILKRKFYD
jgi:predicted nucleotidyltransferase